MNYQFDIQGKSLTLSDEKISYVRMKSHYRTIADKSEEKLTAIFPPVKHKKFFFNVTNSLQTGFVFNTSSSFCVDMKFIFPPDDYKVYSKYTEIRDRFVVEYCNLLKEAVSEIVFELEKRRIYVDMTQLLEKLMKESKTSQMLAECAGYIKSHNKDCSPTRYKYYNYIVKLTEREASEMNGRNDETGIIFRGIVEGFNKCFISICGSHVLDKLIQPGYEYNLYSSSDMFKAVSTCAEMLMGNEKMQETLRKCLWNDIFSCCRLKSEQFAENDVKGFVPVTKEEQEKAAANFRIVSERDIPKEDALALIVDALALDPSEEKYYFAVLDRYGDANGDIQRLAALTYVNVRDHIEHAVMRIFETNSTSDMESVKNVKALIAAEEKKYNYHNSKAARKICKREIFVKYTLKASRMSAEEIIDAYNSIKNGSNTFADGEIGRIPDDKCLLILTRQFRVLNAAECQKIVIGTGLCDDNTGNEKCYGFYIPNKKYLSFENECEKATGIDLPRDENLCVQTYSSYRLASGEVILGYYHYTRNLDLASDCSDIIITNKRIYTKKENFVEISKFTECKPVKKLMMSYLVFTLSDGREIQLPVAKEKMTAASDMMNRLICAVKGEVYVPRYSEPSAAEQAVGKAKSAVKDAAGSAKKEIDSLLVSIGKKINADRSGRWTCTCGASSTGLFCPECGKRKPE
ncbi:MAG: hypothetical protein MJ100_08805 [Ruminococcus sp.]|nr:hypothetical protein [Ruminococcus sp.]